MHDHNFDIQTEQSEDFIRSATAGRSREVITGSLRVTTGGNSTVY